MHIRQVLFHIICREHIDSVEVEWLHDILLDPIVEFDAAGTFEDDTGPIDSDTVFPVLAGVVDEGHFEDVADVGVEDVEAGWAAVVAEFGVETVIDREYSTRIGYGVCEILTIHKQNQKYGSTNSSK